MDGLTDGTGARIVKYSYDVRGNLSREDNGNGTSTVYAYGPTSELLSVVNYASDGTTITLDSITRMTELAVVQA